MKPKLLSFDAAGTLIDVNWQPGRFAIECAAECGIEVDPQVGRESYDRLLHTRWKDYCLVNQTRDDDLCDAFWSELATDWLAKYGYRETHAHHLVSVGRKHLYGPKQSAFTLYPDTVPVLDELKNDGWRMVILSNWDYSLHRIVKNLGIDHYFEKVFASLQEGPEKPDPALFQVVLDQCRATADEAVHIGDNPLDDLEGARSAGWKAIFLDRGNKQANLPTISTLLDLKKAIEWFS
jgi:putative hydrolase of the HAD superfamily